ncbi:hypothetical protein ACKWTF_015257 [Chironomus riparius]
MDCFNFPTELILKIISKLSDIKDLKSCMLLCKEVRQLMFKTPEIMKKIVIKGHIYNDNHFKIFSLINANAEDIQSLHLNISHENSLRIGFLILRKTKNLEELRFSTSRRQQGTVKKMSSIELPKLRILRTDIESLKSFTTITKGIKSLTTFSIKCTIYDHFDAEDLKNLVKFISRQKSLTNLWFNFDEYDVFELPEINIGRKIQLQSLSINCHSLELETPFFKVWLNRQAQHLHELYITSDISDETLQFLFENFVNLKKIVSHLEPKFLNNFQHFKLKYFENSNRRYLTNLQRLVTQFPNLEVIDCKGLKFTDGIFDKIKELILTFFDFDDFQASKFPNLTDLTATNFKCEAQNSFNIFAKNCPKIQHISIKSRDILELNFDFNSLNILKNLNICESLKTFNFSYITPARQAGCRREFVINMLEKTVKFNSKLTFEHLKFLYFSFNSFKFLYFNELDEFLTEKSWLLKADSSDQVIK